MIGSVDKTFYTLKHDNDFLLVQIYMDDIIFSGSSHSLVSSSQYLLKKFNMAELKPLSTLMSSAVALDPDENDDVIDQREYRIMIGFLLYLTATQIDIQFVVGLCACFQTYTRSSNQTVVQRIFRYLKHTIEFEI
jgi:hypothetical protein